MLSVNWFSHLSKMTALSVVATTELYFTFSYINIAFTFLYIDITFSKPGLFIYVLIQVLKSQLKHVLKIV